MADEYCFLWINWWATCLSTDEWASWVQAVGSVGAILAVILVSKQDARRRQNEVTRQQKENDVQTLTKLGRTLLTVYWTLNAMSIEVSKGAGFDATERYLIAQRKQLEELDLFSLPKPEASMFVFDVLVSITYVMSTLQSARDGRPPANSQTQINNDVTVALMNTGEAIHGLRVMIESETGQALNEWRFGRDEFEVSTQRLKGNLHMV